MTDLAFHLASEIFELLDDAELTALAESIRKHGLLEPIWLHPDGSILDGRNRYRACRQAGVEPRFRVWDGAGLATDFVYELNFTRRHLDGGAKDMAAARYAIAREAEAMERSGMRTDLTSGQICPEVAFGRSKEKAADKFGISPRTVQSAVTVIKRGVPELVNLVERDELAVSTAALVAELPEQEQKQIIALSEKEIIAEANRIKREKKELRRAERLEAFRVAAAAVPPIAERYRLYHEDCIGNTRLAPDSVDLIITDPPYSSEYLDCYDGLGALAARVLRPGGLAVVMIGQSYLPEIVQKLNNHLTYHWTVAYLTPGGQGVQQHQRKVCNSWKPVLICAKGEYAGNWFGDVVRSDPNDNDKNYHSWGQSVSGMRDLMKRFVQPGQTVLDPFLGGGTTAIIALELGANFIGFDIDGDAITTTRARIGEISDDC